MIEDRQADKTVIVRLRNFVGDVVLGIPALRLLERHGYRLQLIGKGWAPALLEAEEGWAVQVRPKKLGDRVAQLKALRREARARQPDFDRQANAIALPWSFSAALEMRLAGLKGVGYAHEARGWLLHRSVPMPAPGHALLNYWELACRFLGVDEPPPAEIGMTVSAAQREAAAQLLAQHAVDEPFLLICPFAGGTFEVLDKTWPRFAEFVELAAARGLRLVVCPGPGEEEAATRQYPKALSLPGVKLGVYAALLQRAALVVSNDTGPAHVAAAVGGRVLSVLGPTKPELWAPWGAQVDVLRQYPEWLTPEAVLARAEALLAGAVPSGGAWPFCMASAA